MDMSIPYELSGRTRQKARTRSALIRATRELLGEGITPTVEQAADHAAISRTTAYRYFQNQRSLLVASYPELDAPSLVGADASQEPLERLDAAVRHFTRQVMEHEPELRAQLRLSLDPNPPDELPLRRGRAIGWFEDALAPLRDRMSEADLHRLALAIRVTAGIEALVWLTDVAGVSRDEALEIMCTSARALVRCAIENAATPR
jgi:AcrR family transcriptional regulator